MEKKPLYPLKFIPIPSRRPWGGDSLIRTLGKSFVESTEDGTETPLGTDVRIGESWELADMGFQESVVAQGWLAGNTIGELMETYLDRIVGDNVYRWFGLQFPLLIKFLDIRDRLSVQVHPDDELAAERYDALGKSELWYVLDAAPDAKVYMGFRREISAQELYDRCHDGTVEEVLNVITPRRGDSLFIRPGMVHAADGGILVVEIQESSDMTFRLYDWGRELNPATARPIHLDEAIDIIDYSVYDDSLWRRGPLWENHAEEKGAVTELASCPQFYVRKISLSEPVQASTSTLGSFLVYVCVAGECSIQYSSESGRGMDSIVLGMGETVLVPADMPDIYLVPRRSGTVLLEAGVDQRQEEDSYIDPSTEPFLDGEDYGLDPDDIEQ